MNQRNKKQQMDQDKNNDGWIPQTPYIFISTNI